MPSSLPMQSVQQAPCHPLYQKEVREYRQTMYRDGASVRIEESGRSGVVRKVEPSAEAYVDFVLYPSNSTQATSGSHPHEALHHHPAPKRRGAGSCSNSNATSAKQSSRSRAKPAIVHGALGSSEILENRAKVAFRSSEWPRPPPTPHLTRLSTPELPGLDEAPFCDCGVGEHIVKRCLTCSKEVDPWLM